MRDDDLSLLNQYRLPIMGFAALWILFFHTGVVVLPEGNILYPVYYFVRRIGHLGVDIFFLLSGIGMVFSYEKTKNVLTFWGHRARRLILPMLIMAVLYMMTEPWTIKEFLGNITGIYYFSAGSEHSFLWFYFAAATFYLFFPLYFYGFKRAENKWLYFAVTVGLWLAVSLGGRGIIGSAYYVMTNRIPVFLTGIQLGWLLYNKKKVYFANRIWIMLAGIMAVGLYMEYLVDMKGVFILLPHSDGGVPAWLVSIPLTFILAKFFSCFSRHCGKTGVICLKILGFYGIISYEVYCVQEWIFNLLVKNLLSTGKIGVLCLDLMVFTMTTAFGWLLFRINKNFFRGCQYIFSKKV
ncbi:MAG: acyltransferase family protein [Lachnospiraceae bacterium]